MSHPNPSQLYSVAVADLIYGLDKAVRDDREKLKEIFGEHYAPYRSTDPDSMSESDRIQAGIFAAGLFALGDSSVVRHIAAFPNMKGDVGRLRNVLPAMLPDATETGFVELAEFVDRNRDRLSLSDEEGVYHLRSR